MFNYIKQQSSRLFSTAQEPTQEELEKNRAQWGIQYSDECFKFEKEWKLIADAVE